MEKMTIEAAIECLAKRIGDDVSADDALKFTQAASNLANTLRCLGLVKD